MRILTNKEWLFSLPNNKLAEILKEFEVACDETESCDFVAGNGSDSCDNCIKHWLESEHEEKHYITNNQNEKVVVPAPNSVRYLISTSSTGELYISEFKWQNLKRYLLALYNGVVFANAFDADEYIAKQEKIMKKLNDEISSDDLPY